LRLARGEFCIPYRHGSFLSAIDVNHSLSECLAVGGSS
jgi:hypothetical protein